MKRTLIYVWIEDSETTHFLSMIAISASEIPKRNSKGTNNINIDITSGPGDNTAAANAIPINASLQCLSKKESFNIPTAASNTMMTGS